MRPLTTLVALLWILPAWPAALLISTGGRRRLAAFLFAWLALGALRRWQTRRPASGGSLIYASYVTACAVPFFLSAVWLISAPVLASPSVTVLAGSSLLPLAFMVLWGTLGARSEEWRWPEAVLLPVMSCAVGLVVLEVAGALLVVDPFGANVAINSPDRSYWYIAHKSDTAGRNMATTFGFLGPEPAPTYAGRRVLVIGDSIPAAGRPVNFPQVAQAHYDGALEIVNAAVAGHSLKQIERFYTERLSPSAMTCSW